MERPAVIGPWVDMELRKSRDLELSQSSCSKLDCPLSPPTNRRKLPSTFHGCFHPRSLPKRMFRLLCVCAAFVLVVSGQWAAVELVSPALRVL